MHLSLALLLLPAASLAQAGSPAPVAAAAKHDAPKPAPDTVVFINGEQLTGELENANSDGITFKSAMAGEITVKWANIKELHSEKNFAVLEKGQTLDRKTAFAQVPQGQVTVADKEIHVGDREIPVKQATQLVNGSAFEKAVNRHISLLSGWNGVSSLGTSVVRATQNSTSFNGAVALTRSVPEVSWLRPKNRTLINYTQSYGTTTQIGTAPVETNIFNANAERDRYFSPRLFGFGSVTFNHNFSQNLDLSSAYGGGIGYTVFKSEAQQLDVKADVHYLKETFFVNGLNPLPSANVNVVASTFSETYERKLPKGLLLNEFGSISPSWTDERDFAAHVNGSLGFPIFKGLGFNITAVDDFLNNAPAGTEKNSTQFTTGITYTLKAR